ncbi:hypothetical protein EAF00_003470 [Botryotinia globosa]|nr:hypothetical protein EAF00_003470 [Botryotinia globosa]
MTSKSPIAHGENRSHAYPNAQTTHPITVPKEAPPANSSSTLRYIETSNRPSPSANISILIRALWIRNTAATRQTALVNEDLKTLHIVLDFRLCYLPSRHPSTNHHTPTPLTKPQILNYAPQTNGKEVTVSVGRIIIIL